jgi:hypothetical protein
VQAEGEIAPERAPRVGLAEAAHLPTGHGVLQVGDRTVSVAIKAPAGLEGILRSDVAFTAAQAQGKGG